MKKNIYVLFVLVSASYMLSAQTFTNVATYAGTGTAGLLDGTLGTAKFNGPYSLCCDFSTGNLYVADAGNNSIRKIAGGNVTTLAGNGTQGDVDAQGSNARFYGTSGLCFFNGYVYLADNGNNKVKKIDAAGNVTTVAGTSIGYQDGPISSAKFNNPTDVKVASNGDIYVADYGNNCIRLISNGMVSTFAGVGGSSGDLIGPASSALFNRPSSICFDPTETVLYVADQVNNKVKSISGNNVNLIAGSGAAGNVNATGAAAQFNHPSYIVLDLYGNLLVSEWLNEDIRRVTPSGVTTAVAGSGTAGFLDGPVASAKFNSPYGICVDNAGTIYVGDKLNNRVRYLVKGDLGIHDPSTNAPLNLFPNPSTDHVTILNAAHDIKTIFIYDMQGKLCKTVAVENSTNQVSISIADLAPEQYMILAVGNKTKYTGRLLKQ